jgi:hypothetical protein
MLLTAAYVNAGFGVDIKLTSSISNGLLALYGSDERIINIKLNIPTGIVIGVIP